MSILKKHMQKLIAWCRSNILLVLSLALVAFVPLYPKLPLIDIQNTWVYVRAEDFLVLTSLFVFLTLLVKRSITLNTPLTMPVFMFWAIGGLATLHGVLLIFPTAANVFPNVALLSYVRRIEYMSLFFISYWGIREKRFIVPLATVIALTVFAVSAYGLGQKYLGFPAFLTMNEEFAKGVPIRLSQLSRVPSTFGGHYDLAAYLVLTIPILVGFLFSVKRFAIRALICMTVAMGAYVLFLTVSRISVIALFISLLMVLFFHKRRFIFFIIPIIILSGVFAWRFSPSIFNRFVSTVQEVDVLVDATNGTPIGKVRLVPNTYFENKIIRQQFFTSTTDYSKKQDTGSSTQPTATQSGIIIPYTDIPSQVALLASAVVPTGEDLPQGTGYINLTLSPVTKTLNQFYFELKPKNGGNTVEVQIINGPYLIKKTLAYDLSFTTRFQGEWPNALAAFKKNIFFGSGYGSVSLAVDNSYLRMLGEVGILGFAAFVAIFVLGALQAAFIWRFIEIPLLRSFLIGLGSGVVGLAVNAIFIDVFEASKVAFSLWLFMGAAMGIVHLYQTKTVDAYQALIRALTSPVALCVYVCIVGVALFSPMTGNYFVGDDFTWLRWAADCNSGQVSLGNCPVRMSTIGNYFTDAGGFFYRPGTKVYFLLMYANVWLNQSAYHTVSLLLHVGISILVFVVLRNLFTSVMLSAVGSLIFLFIAGYSESVMWISATGFLFTTLFTMLSLLATIRWNEGKQTVYLIASILFSMLSPMFHEMGIVTPLVSLVYLFMYSRRNIRHLLLLLIPIPLYLFMRFNAGSHWLNGDYSYNVAKFPLNALGNLFGYVSIIMGGPMVQPVYDALRSLLREHMGIGLTLLGILCILAVVGIRKLSTVFDAQERRVVLFGTGFTVISLLPFLGLGNIAPRYGYMATIGVVVVITVCIKKIYIFLRSNGREIANYSMVVLFGIAILVHVIQIQKAQDNWHEAGEIVKRFIISIDSVYTEAWRDTPVELHLVDIPIRNGVAWVFPVGISDAVWFAYRNPDIRVYSQKSLDDALQFIEYGRETQKVFDFDSSGRLIEHTKQGRAP